jgi:hypothetical protein
MGVLVMNVDMIGLALWMVLVTVYALGTCLVVLMYPLTVGLCMIAKYVIKVGLCMVKVFIKFGLSRAVMYLIKIGSCMETEYINTIGLCMGLHRIHLIKFLAILGPFLGMVWGEVDQEMDVRTASMVHGLGLNKVQ